MTPKFDPSYTFDALVVGPGNRLAAAAAGRSAEAPGTYNPLVIHGPPGIGKSHLLHALGQRAVQGKPRLRVLLEPMQAFVDRLNVALAQDRMDGFRKECLAIDLLLLDDAEVLAGKVRTQNELLPIWDRMGQNGAQVVLASALAPPAIDALHLRLESRFARLLVVEVQPPTQETRTTLMIRGGPGEAPVPLGVPAHAAGPPRRFDADEFGPPPHPSHAAPHRSPAAGADPAPPPVATPPADEDPFGSFLDDITATLEEVVDAAPWRTTLSEKILRWGGEGMRTWRLEHALHGENLPDVDGLIGGFEADCSRLQQITTELARIAPAAAGSPVLRDPDRLAEAEALLFTSRLERLPLPEPPPGLTLANFVGRNGMETGAVTLVRRLVAGDAGIGKLLYAQGPAERCTHYLAAVGHAARETRGGNHAFLSGGDAVSELRAAIEAGLPELWRRRYETAALLLVDGIEAFLEDEQFQHALAAVIGMVVGAGGRVMLSGSRPWRSLEGLDPRLAARLGAAETVDLAGAAPRRLLNGRGSRPLPVGADAASAADAEPGIDRWFLDREKVAWDWAALDDRLVEEFV
jgi:chromosomal replication initiation ATPase DnaA